MKPVISSLSALAACVLITAPTASALTCSQQASALQKQQAKAQKLAEARLTLVDEVEAAGDTWQEAEAMRNYGQAASADEAKLTYETLKSDLMDKEASLQTLVASLNEDVAAYNAKCVKD